MDSKKEKYFKKLQRQLFYRDETKTLDKFTFDFVYDQMITDIQRVKSDTKAKIIEIVKSRLKVIAGKNVISQEIYEDIIMDLDGYISVWVYPIHRGAESNRDKLYDEIVEVSENNADEVIQ